MVGKEKSMELQPELIEHISWGFARSQALITALQLDLFSFINEGQSTIEKLSRVLGSPMRSVRIFLDALVGMGILGKSRGAYKLTLESKTFLVRGEAEYLGNYLTNLENPHKKWVHLTEVVHSGKPLDEFDTPEQKAIFFKDLVKAIFSPSFSSGVILAKKLGVGRTLKGQSILDVGCGAAPWSLAMAVADTSCQVVAVDHPDVLEVTQTYTKKFRATRQYEFKPGDYHEVSFGKEAFDMVILGHICHIEGESGSKKLIKKSYDALKTGGKLLVAEFIANDLKTGPEIPLLFALNMLLFTEHGDVFTGKDFKRWMSHAGFKKVSAQAAQFPCTVMVGTK